MHYWWECKMVYLCRKQQTFLQRNVFVQFSSVTQSCLTLCDPMDCRTPGFPVHRQLPELAQTHVHWVGVAILSSVRWLINTWRDAQHHSLLEECKSKTTMRYHLTLDRMTIIKFKKKKFTNDKCWRGCGEKGTLLHCWWGCKLIQPLWRTVLFSHSVVSDSLWPHGLQNTRFPCPSPFPGACSNLHLLSR